MRNLYLLGLTAILASGCASGSGGSIFPEAGDADAAIANAEQQISMATGIGADSLAADAMASARQNLASARSMNTASTRDRSALAGRQAAADAIFAQERAKLVMAERMQAQAKASLDALPPNGGSR
ncbi:MAG: hypothetical protein H7Z74_16715 [Anaerolineae bacterium]|nr:hypothetical protein [Gemmatimonadaceae bacterium]